MEQHILLDLAAIIILGIGAQWLAWRLRMPSILFLLLFGFLAGPITGFLQTEALMGDLLLPFVSLSVGVILFEGSLTLNIKEFREIGNVVLSLITVGMLVTWAIASTAAYYVLGLNPGIAILLGSILVVTGPTVIGPLLRHIKPKGKVADILKWEGIVIDPVGALFAVLVFEGVMVGGLQDASTQILLNLGKTVLFGGLTGIFFATVLIIFLKNFWLPDYLEETGTLALVIFAYIVSDMLQHESGLFATTLMGIIMANQRFVAIKHILEFKENLSVLIISTLFIILSSRLDISVFNHISLGSIIFLAILIFLARPLSVVLSTPRSKLNWREKAFLSWMAPRGIVAASVASIFALRLNEAGYPQAEYLVPLTFVVITGTVAIYGLTAKPLAMVLKVAQSNPQGVLFIGAHTWSRKLALLLQKQGFDVALVDTNRADVGKANNEGLKAYNGSAFSEHIMDELRLDGIGRMLAITPNDEANSMSVLHFNEVFESEELYQLRPDKETRDSGQSFSPKHLRGRYLFDENADFDEISQRLFAGHQFVVQEITQEFTFQRFENDYDLVLPLFIIIKNNKNKELQIVTADREPLPKPGQTLVALVK